MVEDFQHEAKLSFAKGRCMYTKAYTQFKKAAYYAELLEKTPENLHLLATLYANCSLIQLKKENFRTCLNDCKKALDIEVRIISPFFPPASLQESALPQGQGSRGSQRSPRRLGVLRSDFGRRAGQCVHAQAENRVRIASAQGAEAERRDRSERTALFGVSHAQEQRKEAEQQLVRKTMDARGYKVGFFAGMLTRSWVPPCINTPTGTKRRSL